MLKMFMLNCPVFSIKVRLILEYLEKDNFLEVLISTKDGHKVKFNVN